MAFTKCKKCGETKADEEFWWGSQADGYKVSMCKDCRDAYARKQKEKKETEKEVRRAKAIACRAKARAYARKQKEKKETEKESPEVRRAKAIACRAKARAKARRRYQANREEILAYARQYRQDNKEAVAAKQRQYSQTPEAKAVRNARSRAQYATAEGKVYKAAKRLHREFFLGLLTGDRVARGEKLAGCSREQYRNHIASQFKKGMSYDNYGDWQINHIVPKRAFYGELKDYLAVFYWYGNAQPLWKAEEIANGAQYTDEAKQSLISRYESWKAAGSPPPGL